MATKRGGRREGAAGSKAGPVSLGALLAATAVGRAAKEVSVTRALWEEVAGVVFARRTTPDRLERGTLYVVVSSSGWAQELNSAERTLVERLRARGVDVERLRARVGEVETSDRGGVVAPSRAAIARARGAGPDTSAKKALERVDDPSLRAAAEGVARAMARRDAEAEVRGEARANKPKPRVPGR